MLDILFSSLPFITVFAGLGAVFLHTFKLLPNIAPEVVLVRSPYGYPLKQLETEKKLYDEENKKLPSQTYHLQFSIQSQQETERAMIEIANRLHWFFRYFTTPWFVIHAPSVNTVRYLETLLVTHGYTVSVMDIQIPTKDGFPTKTYYEWAESCSFIKHDEDRIQSYHSSWQSWPNTGIHKVSDIVSKEKDKDD